MEEAVPANAHSRREGGREVDVGREGWDGAVGRKMRMSTKYLAAVVRTWVLGGLLVESLLGGERGAYLVFSPAGLSCEGQ